MNYLNAILICFLVICSNAYGQQSPVEIGEIQFRELYAVEYRTYMREPVGKMEVRNRTEDEIRLVIVAGGHRYINAPTEMTAMIPAGQGSQIPLYLDLDIGVLELGRQLEYITISIKLTAYNSEAEVFRSDDLTGQIALHDRHKIPEGDPAKIAMFVDPDDRYIASEVSEILVEIEGKTNEQKAKTVFDYLKRKGIYCIGEGGTQVQYPRELLRTKLGSIYDGSLLYAAILEMLDVKVELIFSPDTMLPLYKYEGEWYPVDMNMLAENFQNALRSGDALRGSLTAMEANTIILREAWKKYPPLWFPVLSSEDMPLFRTAGEYIKADKLENAASAFEQLLDKYPKNPVLLNNSANVELMMGNMEQAVEKYALAVSRSPDDGGLYLNMGIAYHKMGDEAKGIDLIRKAHTKLGSYTAMRNMLNLDEQDEVYREVDDLLRKAGQSSGISSIALAARSIIKSRYPLYWKRFHR